MLALRDPVSGAALTIGYAKADEAKPELEAKFATGTGGVLLQANARFLGRTLPAGDRARDSGRSSAGPVGLFLAAPAAMAL